MVAACLGSGEDPENPFDHEVGDEPENENESRTRQFCSASGRVSLSREFEEATARRLTTVDETPRPIDERSLTRRDSGEEGKDIRRQQERARRAVSRRRDATHGYQSINRQRMRTIERDSQEREVIQSLRERKESLGRTPKNDASTKNTKSASYTSLLVRSSPRTNDNDLESNE